MPIRTHNNGARKPFTTQVVCKGGFGSATLTGNTTLDKFSAQWLKLDPGGAHRDVTLPEVEDGLFFDIVNAADAAENLVIKNAAGSTIVTINQNERAVVWSDGSSWVLHFVHTIALS